MANVYKRLTFTLLEDLKKIEQSNDLVLIIGDLMLDSYLVGNTRRVSPEAPIPVVAVESEEEKLGGAANVAANVHALGGRCCLLGVVGEDQHGDTLTKLLETQGIPHRVMQLADTVTTNKNRVICRNQQLLRIDREKIRNVSNTDLQRVQKHAEQIVEPNCSLILSDYGKGLLHRPQDFIRSARARGARVFVDPKGSSFEPYRGAYVVTPNQSEFESVAGACNSVAELKSTAISLCESLDIEYILITRSDKGMLLVGRDSSTHEIAADVHEVFDVTGAGDTVIAMLATAVAAGVSIERAVDLANLAAGIVVQKLGAATVTPKEIALKLHATLDRVPSVDELLEHIHILREGGYKIVMTNGCFDLLHQGHVSYLQQAKAMGDYLIVAINDDASVKRLKGPERPINPLEARQLVLQALQSVDFVIAFSEDTPQQLIEHISPDILVKGGDYRPEQIAGAEHVLNTGGRVEVLPFVEGYSTSSIIRRLQS